MFKNFDAIQVGDSQTLNQHITEADVRKFVEMTGDDNPLHVDRSYAETTAFKDVVVHGMLGERLSFQLLSGPSYRVPARFGCRRV